MKGIIPHSRPAIDVRDAKAVGGVVRSGHLAQGAQVTAFEHKFAHFQSARGAVAVNSGTSALHLSLLALGVGAGDEVIIPAYVCTALLNAVNYIGATPCVVDVNSDDFNMSTASVKKNITKKTKAIIVPHMFGQPADLKSLLHFGVPVIEDCAQSVGAGYAGKRVGSLGVLSIFSFYATKVMACGEGGMITSNNARMLNKIRDLRDYDNRPKYKVRYNYKMTDMAAALGLSQLRKLPVMLSMRKSVAKYYSTHLRTTDFEIPMVKENCEHIFFRYVIKVRRNHKRIISVLKSKGIQCSAPVYKPLHHYLSGYSCPITDQLMKEALSIPIYPSLKSVEKAYIVKNFKSF